jgi:hypothetical protein
MMDDPNINLKHVTKIDMIEINLFSKFKVSELKDQAWHQYLRVHCQF